MLLSLRTNLPGPLYRQLFESLRLAIIEGQISYQQQLPPSRELAQQLSISRNTVNTAYDMLVAEGYVSARQGSGYRVCAQIPEFIATPLASDKKPKDDNTHTLSKRGLSIAKASRPVPKLTNPAFQPGLPDLSVFPFQLWQRCVNHCLKRNEQSLYKYSDQGGYGPLKTALRNYLKQSRGVECEAEQIVIVNGSQAGLDLVARMLVDDGETIAMEDPGYLGAKDGFEASGAKLLPIEVDSEGISVKQLNRIRRPIKLVYTTPSYQFPLGVTMSFSRRSELLAWAKQRQAFIIEDDYDSEFRFRERPISSLQGLDPRQQVIYIGTLSKVMFPGLRLGFIVVPTNLASAFANALRKTGQDAPLLWQAALTEFINEGYFISHIRRMRKIYAEKQQVLVSSIQQHADEFLSVEPTAAGMQLPAYFTKFIDEDRLRIQAQQESILLTPLSRYYNSPKHPKGLYLGYSGIAVDDIEGNVKRMTQVLSKSLSA